MGTTKSKFGLGLLVGAIGGALAGLFLSEKPGKELRKKTHEQYDRIKKRLEESDVETVVKEIFGDVSEESKKRFIQAKKEIAIQLSTLKTRIEEVDRKKYVSIVADVVREVKKDGNLPDKTLAKLKTYLESDYQKLAKKSSTVKAGSRKTTTKKTAVKAKK